MRAKTCSYRLHLGSKALDYIHLIENTHRVPVKETGKPEKTEALGILETFQEEPEELDISIAGKDLIRQLDNDFDDMGLVPYYFSKAAREAGDQIAVGWFVRIPGLQRRFRVLDIMRRLGSIRLKDSEGIQYVFPWDMVLPVHTQPKD